MKTLVTGATGYLGAALVRALCAAGEPVRCLVRSAGRQGALEGLDVEWVPGDVRDIDSMRRALAGCNRVYHLAALYTNWLRRSDVIYRINEEGTRNVLSACLEARVEKVVHCSSVAALGAHGRVPADEGARFNLDATRDHYYISKFRAEQIALTFARRGLPVVIVNPSNPIGPGDTGPTPTGALIVNILKKRIPAYVDGGINLIDLGDCARGMVAAMQRGRCGEKYILGNLNVSVKQYFDLIVRAAGRGFSPFLRMPRAMAILSAFGYEAVAWLTGKPPVTSASWVRVGSHYSWWDCRKAQAELGLGRRPIEESLREAAAWFIEHGYAGKSRAERVAR
jgi:dihydroflavonol-4-reductase